ncbi:Uma2 family endonuclease [bacterium 210820-DFI.6.37]|nr:Uma2 family endonuclease [bacterium 210820-DFI.6.37]
MNIERLKKRKKEMGLTNKQLSEISGVSLGTINKIFSGATKAPQIDTLAALAAALGLEPYSQSPEASALLRETAALYTLEKKQGTYTMEDYYALPDDARAELIDGVLIFMDAPTVTHQSVIGDLYYFIRHYIKTKKGPCKVLLSPLEVRLNEDDRTILQPDLVILCDPKKNDGRRINGAPDFIAEVVSSSSRKRDYLIKLNKYWTAGVKEYWIIDPKKQTVTVYRFQGSEDDFQLNTYTFQDTIPLGLYEDCAIDFKEFEL